MNYRTLALLSLLIAASHPSLTLSAPLDANKASSLIKDMAEAMCGEMFNGGHSNSRTLSADATLKVNNILKQIVDAGGSIKGDISSSDYYGVLHDQLGETIKNGQQCRLHVWDDLKVLLVGKSVDLGIQGDCNQVVTGANDASLNLSCNR